MRISQLAQTARYAWGLATGKTYREPYGHPINQSFENYEANVDSFASRLTGRQYFLGLDLLEMNGLSESKINHAQVDILNYGLEACNENNFPVSEYAKHLSRLIDKGASNDVLLMFTYAALYLLNEKRDIDELTGNFLQLIKEDPTNEEWEVLKHFVSEHLDVNFPKLIESFTQIVKEKPQQRILDLYKGIIDYSKTQYRGILRNNFTISNSFLELIRAKPTEEEWNTCADLIEHHQKINYYLDDLIKHFTKLVNQKPSQNELEAFKDLVSLYKPSESELHSLTSDFASLLVSKPNQDEINTYKCAIEFCKKTGWAPSVLTTSFVDLVNIKATPEELKFYRDTLRQNLDEKFNILIYTDAFTKICSAKPDIPQLNRFNDTALSGTHVVNYANSYKGLITAKPTSDEWEFYDSLIKYQKEHNFTLHGFTEGFANLISAKLVKAEWQLYKELAEKYMVKGWSLDRLTITFANLIQGDASPLILQTYKAATEFHLSIDDQLSINIAHDNIVKLLNEDAHPTLFKNYIKSVQKGKLKTKTDSVRLLVNLVVHAATSNLIRSKVETKQDESRNIISYSVLNDPLPYPQKDLLGNPHPEALKAQGEVERVCRRAFNIHHGNGALTYECKKNPAGEPWLLARFGRDAAEFVEFINAKDSKSFPGKGVMISRLIPEKIFVFDEEAWGEEKDPYHKYKEAWPFAQDEFEDLKHAQFIFTRGFIAISCPTSKKYELIDANGNKVNYSYIIYNDHHENYNSNVAYLVPTNVLKNKLWGTTISYEDYRGFSMEDKNINDVGLLPEDLAKDAQTIPANVLNLCWGSNIGGGLCNAYPVGSSPFHTWETKKKMKGQTKDFYGHTHKSHITGRYERSMTRKQEILLEPLQLAHKQVFEVTNKYQNLLDLFRLSLALWHKGQTAGELTRPYEPTDDYLFENTYINEADQVLERGVIGDLTENPNLNRMLMESYKWNKGREQEGSDKNNFPILIVADTLDYWSIPNSPVYLDTFDMTLTIDGEKIQLPTDTDGTGSEETNVWYNYVIPHIQSTAKDLRFYDRRELGID